MKTYVITYDPEKGSTVGDIPAHLIAALDDAIYYAGLYADEKGDPEAAAAVAESLTLLRELRVVV